MEKEKSPLDRFFLNEEQSKWYMKGRENAFKELGIIISPDKETEYWKSWRMILEMKGLEKLELLKKKNRKLHEEAWDIWINARHHDLFFNLRGEKERQEFNNKLVGKNK